MTILWTSTPQPACQLQVFAALVREGVGQGWTLGLLGQQSARDPWRVLTPKLSKGISWDEPSTTDFFCGQSCFNVISWDGKNSNLFSGDSEASQQQTWRFCGLLIFMGNTIWLFNVAMIRGPMIIHDGNYDMPLLQTVTFHRYVKKSHTMVLRTVQESNMAVENPLSMCVWMETSLFFTVYGLYV